MFKLVLISLAAIISLQAAGEDSVWMGMDQQALDDAYDQRVYAANLRQVLARFESNSEAARAKLGEPLRFAYGNGADEGMDVYATETANAPIHIFIHGGAWRMAVAKDNAHAAEMFVRNGVHFVVPDFSPVQNFDRNLEPMVEQLRSALRWIYLHAEESFDGDPSRIYLSGFSSGGHLASVLLTTQWKEYGADLPADLIKGGVLCSGMYDLVPVSLSARRNYVNFNDSTIEELSAIRHVDKIGCPVVLAYGTEETPEFQRQAQAFAEALIQEGVETKLIVAEHYNHFEVIETMANPYRPLGEAALSQIFDTK